MYTYNTLISRMANQSEQVGSPMTGSIILSGGIVLEPDDEFQQWASEYTVKIDEHDAYPDQQLLIWYANKGFGRIQTLPAFGDKVMKKAQTK